MATMLCFHPLDNAVDWQQASVQFVPNTIKPTSLDFYIGGNGVVSCKLPQAADDLIAIVTAKDAFVMSDERLMKISQALSARRLKFCSHFLNNDGSTYPTNMNELGQGGGYM